MKLRSFAAAIAAGGLLAAAGPSFAVNCGVAGVSDTLALWAGLGAAGCTDAADVDTRWVFVSATVPLATSFNVSEVQGIGFDVYNVAFGFDPALTTAANGQTISFTATDLSGTEPFTAGDYDTNVTEPVGGSGAISTARITGASGPLNLWLPSTDGSHPPPPSGETPFASNSTIAVTDTFVTIPTGIVLNAANNSF